MEGNRFHMIGNYCSNRFDFFFPCRTTDVVASSAQEQKNKLLVFAYYAFFKTKWKKKGNRNSDHEGNPENSRMKEQKCLLPSIIFFVCFFFYLKRLMKSQGTKSKTKKKTII